MIHFTKSTSPFLFNFLSLSNFSHIIIIYISLSLSLVFLFSHACFLCFSSTFTCLLNNLFLFLFLYFFLFNIFPIQAIEHCYVLNFASDFFSTHQKHHIPVYFFSFFPNKCISARHLPWLSHSKHVR